MAVFAIIFPPPKFAIQFAVELPGAFDGVLSRRLFLARAALWKGAVLLLASKRVSPKVFIKVFGLSLIEGLLLYSFP